MMAECLMKPVLLACMLLFAVACNGKNVVGNTYAAIGGHAVTIDPGFNYVGDARYYQDFYYCNVSKTKAAGSRPVDVSVFVSEASPRSLLIITRWTTKSGGWVSPDWTIREYDGVEFWDRAFVSSAPRGEIVEYLSAQGHDFTHKEYYAYTLRKNVNRKAQYDIMLFEEKGDLPMVECLKVKQHMQARMSNIIVLKD